MSIKSITLLEVYSRLNHTISKTSVEDVIWEVNDRLDGNISMNEYMAYYNRCKCDQSGLEPMDFYYLLCFLMYDKSLSGTLTIDEAMHML